MDYYNKTVKELKNICKINNIKGYSKYNKKELIDILYNINNNMNDIKQNTGLKRNNIDKFYTKKEIAELCINNIKKYLKINKDELIIEPSAGNGVFIEYIKQLSNNYKFYDILPENEDIIKEDFLECKFNDIYNIKKHIIGNPPFGRQSSKAIKFIKKSILLNSDSISFILPKSFKKQSLQKHFSLNYHLIYQFDLPHNSFLIDNEEYNVNCVFQIWKKENYNRLNIEKIKPYNFEFVKKNDNPDIFIRRVGVYAGKIGINYQDKNIQSHYFIKFINIKNKDNIIKKLNNINFDIYKNNTVGARSISKQEIIIEFNKIMNDN